MKPDLSQSGFVKSKDKPRKPGVKITPERMAQAGTEHAEQTALFIWASDNVKAIPALRMLFAIPNGGERNVIVAANLKAEGTKSGVPDTFLAVARGGWHGLFIELKKLDGKPRPTDEAKLKLARPDQRTWIANLRSEGYGAMVAVGWVEARDAILAYLRQNF